MANETMSARARRWAPLILIGIGVLVLALPGTSEGDVLVPISEGHGLTAVDAAGVTPLIVGIVWCEWILWRERRILGQRIAARPGLSGSLIFVAGLGLGLLFASVLPSFWWWAVGAALAGTCFLAVVVSVLRR